MTEPNQPRSEASRQRRSAHRQLAERQQRRTRLIWIGAAVVALVVVAIAAYVILSRKETPPPVVGDILTYSDLSRNHTTAPVSYAQNPPVGGDHDPVWQDCGYYDEPVQNENAVRSFEHGAIWITYNPDLPQEQIDALEDAGGKPDLHPGQPDGQPSGAGRRLGLGEADPSRQR